jgi:hypothetical protein
MASKPESKRTVSDLARSLWERNSTGLIAVLLTVPALFLAGRHDLRHWQVTILWSGVFLMVGGMIGFLFGVPSARPQTDASPAEAHLQINTNLEQISDWLTKILIGLALVNLKDLPDQLGRLTAYVAKGLDGATDEQFVAALVFYFGAAGFLLGFVGARVYLRLLSTELGSRTVARLADSVEATLARQVERALRGPAMVNYEGFLCLVLRESSAPLYLGQSAVLLQRATGALEIEAWLQRDLPREDPYIRHAPVSIREGEDRTEAEFEIRVDADDFHANGSSRAITASRDAGTSAHTDFHATFDLKPEPGDGDRDDEPGGPRMQHPLWIMLFQQNRLVQTITLDFKVG